MSISPLFTDPSSAPHKDVATFANYYEVATEHVHLDWTIDWKKRVFGGSATLTMGVRKEGVKEVRLDVAFLDVEKVEVDGKEAVSQHSDSDRAGRLRGVEEHAADRQEYTVMGRNIVGDES